MLRARLANMLSKPLGRRRSSGTPCSATRGASPAALGPLFSVPQVTCHTKRGKTQLCPLLLRPRPFGAQWQSLNSQKHSNVQAQAHGPRALDVPPSDSLPPSLHTPQGNQAPHHNIGQHMTPSLSPSICLSGASFLTVSCTIHGRRGLGQLYGV